MITANLIIGFIAGAVWVMAGFFVCVTVVDRCLMLRRLIDYSIFSSLLIIMLWPLALLPCSMALLVQKKRQQRNAL
ncbi:MAG: hypothetical protein OQK32_00445 [Gammaproteobacteria bacterium]|nr:hypothetical protein [Gammaproteobacteria bacterium]MCW8924085.1 hypothetical protein [Gammaproteobacteria bacterium]